MKLHALQALVAAIEEGSLRGAARRIGVSQPALTKLVRELEIGLAAPLLIGSRLRAGDTFLGGSDSNVSVKPRSSPSRFVRTLRPLYTVLVAATGWVEALLLGSLGSAIAVIAVALLGFGMLTGRTDLRDILERASAREPSSPRRDT